LYTSFCYLLTATYTVNKYVHLRDGRISTHGALRPHAARFHKQRICSVTITVALPTLPILRLFTAPKMFFGGFDP